MVLLLGVAACLPTAAASQLEVSARGASVRVGGLVQTQYTTSSVKASNDGANVRRARIRTDVSVNDFLTGRVVTDFGGSSGTGIIVDADVSAHFSEAFVVSMGQFKRAFDLFELPNPSLLPEIEKDGRVAGYSACTGVGSVCSYSRFTENLQLAGRDRGLRVDGTAGRFTYLATATNGTGINTADENDTKSYSGRATFAVTEDVRVSGQLALHDYPDANGDATAVGFGGDVELGTWRDGLHVRGALITGDNWKSLDPTTQDPATFLTYQAIATYYVPHDGDRIEGIEPMARLSFGDPDTATSDDGGILFTPGVMFYVQGRSRIGANLDIYSPQTGDSEISFQLQTTLYF